MNWSRVRRLSRLERRMLLRAALYLVSVDIGFRIMGYARLERLIARQGARRSMQVDHRFPHRCAYWVERAARKVDRRYQCFHRSLALHAWLRRSGVPSQIKIGVRKSGSSLAAHAWIEVDGQVVGEAPGAAAPFTPLSAMAIDPVRLRRPVPSTPATAAS